jgi:hypothetical protein
MAARPVGIVGVEAMGGELIRRTTAEILEVSSVFPILPTYAPTLRIAIGARAARIAGILAVVFNQSTALLNSEARGHGSTKHCYTTVIAVSHARGGMRPATAPGVPHRTTTNSTPPAQARDCTGYTGVWDERLRRVGCYDIATSFEWLSASSATCAECFVDACVDGASAETM